LSRAEDDPGGLAAVTDAGRRLLWQVDADNEPVCALLER